MATERSVRQSVSLPTNIAKRITAIAKTRRTSANRVLVDLIETGLEAKEAEKRRFFEVVERFRAEKDPEQVKLLGEELGRLVFGE